MKRYAVMLASFTLLTVCGRAGQFGTGFAISPKGYLVTCHHVVRDAERVIVHCEDGYLEAKIVALDPRNDLAILKVEKWPGKYLGLSSSEEVTHASEILAAGFPDPSVLGRNPKISTGIVNAMSGVRDDPRYIQISAPVQPGNSGGPLLSSSGRVVGVVASGLNSMDRMAHGGYLPQSVNFAIKAELILPLLKAISVSVPKIGTRTRSGPKQVNRSINAIALIEGIKQNEQIYGGSPPGVSRASLREAASPNQPTGSPSLVALRGSNTPSSGNAGPWIFQDSHVRPLEPGEVSRLSKNSLWRARNEIYLRHGFIFPTAEGQQFAREFGNLYQPVTPSVDAVKQKLSPVEVANLRLIAGYE